VADDSTDETTTTIDRYGVMGYPVSHSRSPVIHRLFALQTGQIIQYELLQVSPEKLETAVRQFQRTGGKGLNITVPHKSEVVRLVDQMSERAATAGAVNTLLFKGGEIYGDNTDGIGLLRDLAVNLGVTLEGSKILVLGAGGATRGIIGPLLEMQPASTQPRRDLKAKHHHTQRPPSRGQLFVMTCLMASSQRHSVSGHVKPVLGCRLWAGACWLSRQPSRSICGAAFVLRPSRYSNR